MPYLNIEYIYYKIYLFISGTYNFLFGLDPAFPVLLFWVKIFALFVSAIFIAGTIYSILQLMKLNKKEMAEFAKLVVETPPEERTSRWDRIKQRSQSDNSSDWRRAILEADSLLEEIFAKIGYKGETFGERLTHIKPAQFENLNGLWQAHKLRNRIAHEGDRYKLTKEQTDLALALYEKALKELEYI